MAFEVQGKLHVVNDTQQVTQRFTKREFVVEVQDGKYPQHVLFQLTGDRCGNLDGFNVGDEVKIQFNLRGREWTSPKGEVKYFNSLDVWKLERAGGSAGAFDDGPPPPSDPPPDMDMDDDIPF